VTLNYQENNYYYWKAIAAEVKDHIAKEEAWMDEEPSWRENPKDIPERSYYKKFDLVREYLKVCETYG